MRGVTFFKDTFEDLLDNAVRAVNFASMSMLPTLSECNLLSGLAWTGPGAGGHGAGRGHGLLSVSSGSEDQWPN